MFQFSVLNKKVFQHTTLSTDPQLPHVTVEQTTVSALTEREMEHLKKTFTGAQCVNSMQKGTCLKHGLNLGSFY